jgi:SAM-dependent methyltransferase
MALTDPQSAVDYYDQGAPVFARRYDGVTFESVHAYLADLLPVAGAAVLDVGAGSGRDARALAARGFWVTAVEPSGVFRQLARKDPRVAWIDDRLPALSNLLAQNQRFAFILCSAVLMLVPRYGLAPSLVAMSQLLEAGGILAINLRDPVPDEPAELVYAHSNEDILAASREAGLDLIRQNVASDALGRESHRWRAFVFSLKEAPPFGPT